MGSLIKAIRGLFEFAGAISLLLAIGLGAVLATTAGALVSASVFLQVAVIVGVFLLVVALVLFVREDRVVMEMEPFISSKMNKTDHGYTYDTYAYVIVRNARDSGGTRGTAERVTPQIEWFDDGSATPITDYVGWDSCSERDFRPTREEHRLGVAIREHGERYVVAPYPGPDHGFGLGWGSRFRVRITLRGDNFRPIGKEFRLSFDPDEASGLTLVPGFETIP